MCRLAAILAILSLSFVWAAAATDNDFASNEMDGDYRGRSTVWSKDDTTLFLSAINLDDGKNTVAILLEVVRRGGACVGSFRGLGTAINKTTILLEHLDPDQSGWQCRVKLTFDEKFETAVIVEERVNGNVCS